MVFRGRVIAVAFGCVAEAMSGVVGFFPLSVACCATSNGDKQTQSAD